PQAVRPPVSVHPPRTAGVAPVTATGASSVLPRIEPEEDTNDLRPVGTFLGRVEKADIEREVLSVVVRQHLALYVRLLDAAQEGADWTEVVRVLFGLDPRQDAGRARSGHGSHAGRARRVHGDGRADCLG